MDIRDLEMRHNKLNVLAEFKIFQALQHKHLDEQHETNKIYLCPLCCDDCDELLDMFLTNNFESKD